MFQFFERLVQPYPDAEPSPPPKRFFPFLWACTRGLRPYMIAMTLCTAVIGAFEALLFAFLGRVVDWLGATTPARLWADQGHNLMLLAGVLAASLALVADVLPEGDTAKNLGVLNIAGALPFSVAPAIAPVVLTVADGSYGVLYAGAGICAVLGGLAILPVKRVR